MCDYGIPCSVTEYFEAIRGREATDYLLRSIMTDTDAKSREHQVATYNFCCELYGNDRCDYTLEELEDMYYGPFSIRPECFSVETMYIQ